MLTKIEHLKLRAIDQLNERIEREISLLVIILRMILELHFGLKLVVLLFSLSAINVSAGVHDFKCDLKIRVSLFLVLWGLPGQEIFTEIASTIVRHLSEPEAQKQIHKINLKNICPASYRMEERVSPITRYHDDCLIVNMELGGSGIQASALMPAPQLSILNNCLRSNNILQGGGAVEMVPSLQQLRSLDPDEKEPEVNKILDSLISALGAWKNSQKGFQQEEEMSASAESPWPVILIAPVNFTVPSVITSPPNDLWNGSLEMDVQGSDLIDTIVQQLKCSYSQIAALLGWLDLSE